MVHVRRICELLCVEVVREVTWGTCMSCERGVMGGHVGTRSPMIALVRVTLSLHYRTRTPSNNHWILSLSLSFSICNQQQSSRVHSTFSIHTDTGEK